jgi:electron transfer flavoprotein beta subunit
MKILVVIKQVPDLVEELEINSEGTALDPDCISPMLNEFDDHALEEALLLKEAVGGAVTVLGIDTTGELDQTLYTALAKGADTAKKIVGDFDEEHQISSHTRARLLAEAIRSMGMSYDLIVVGVQAVDDLDGQVAPMLATHLGIPHVGVVTAVHPINGTISIHKEYWGGMVAEMDVTPPAVLGIQAARQAPRYAPVSKVRQVSKEATIEEIEAGDLSESERLVVPVRRMYLPESGGQAEFIEGEPEEVAETILTLLSERGLR